MAKELESQLSDPDTYSSLGFEERIALLVDAEWNRRQANKLAKCIRDAGFSAPNACMEEIEYHPDRKLDKTQLTRFSTCKYIDDGRHIILSGAAAARRTLHVHLAMLPAENLKKYVTYAFLSFWKN